MGGRVCSGDSTQIMFIPSHSVVELRPLDVGFVIENIAISLRCSKEDAVGAKAEHITIDLMVACNPQMSLTSQRPVEIGN